MKNSKRIQIGLLALVAGLLLANLIGVFDLSDWNKTPLQTQNAISSGEASSSVTSIPKAKTSEKVPVPMGPLTNFEFEKTEYDFGTITAGEKAKYSYTFKNTGSEPLLISNAKAPCGCTVPSWPKEPIPVGATGEIVVEFSSKGKKGAQNKRIAITANTNPAQSFITIKGNVDENTAEVVAVK